MPKVSKAAAVQLLIESITLRTTYKSVYIKSKSIHLTAVFNANHYGYFSDLIQGPINTSVIDKSSARIGIRTRARSPTRIDNGPISCQFIVDGVTVDGSTTQSLNTDPRSRIFSAYVDGALPENAIGREDYILQNGNVTI